MTTKTSDEIARSMARLEEGVSVTAGSLNTEAFYRRVERQKEAAEERSSPYSVVLGLFLNMARRDKRLSIETLAEQVDSSPLELLLIEEGHHVPEPRVLSKLSRVLEVPPGKLMQLAGHVQSLDQDVARAAYRFAASGSTKPLEPEERAALIEFVNALASS